jgi:type II secretory pathway pseudopilin PulG
LGTVVNLSCEALWGRSRSGFSIIEAVMVLVIVATILAALSPSVARQLTHARTNRAALVVAADFYQAQALAGRMRSPVRVGFDPTSKAMVLFDAATNNVISRRELGSDSEFKLATLSSTSSYVLVLPNGTSNVSVTVTIGGAGYSRAVTMSRAGQIRIN